MVSPRHHSLLSVLTLSDANRSLTEAVDKSKQYEWMSAAGAYNRTLELYEKSLDLVQVSQLRKAEADCYFEAAFQSESRAEFKRRMMLSHEAYETTSSLYSGSGRLGVSDLLKCRALFSTYWLTDEAAERASIMAQILPLAERATKRLE